MIYESNIITTMVLTRSVWFYRWRENLEGQELSQFPRIPEWELTLRLRLPRLPRAIREHVGLWREPGAGQGRLVLGSTQCPWRILKAERD